MARWQSSQPHDEFYASTTPSPNHPGWEPIVVDMPSIEGDSSLQGNVCNTWRTVISTALDRRLLMTPHNVDTGRDHHLPYTRCTSVVSCDKQAAKTTSLSMHTWNAAAIRHACLVFAAIYFPPKLTAPTDTWCLR